MSDITDTERSIEQECDSLEAEALKGGEFVGITNDLALRLVAALRSERGANQVLRENATWNEEDADELERVSAELERERTQNRRLYDALQLMVDKLGTWSGFGQSEKRAFEAARAALSTQEESTARNSVPPCWRTMPICSALYAPWIQHCDCARPRGHEGGCICGHELAKPRAHFDLWKSRPVVGVRTDGPQCHT